MAGVALAACGSNAASPGKHHHSTRPKAHHPTSSSTHPSKASLSQLESKLSSGQMATFEANYSLSLDESGKVASGTFTVAHEGTKALIGASVQQGTFKEIVNGSKSTFCAAQGGKWTCFSGAEAAAISAEVKDFTGTFTAKGELAAIKAQAAESYGVTTSSQTIGGQSATCWTYHSKVDKGLYTACVTSNDVLAKAYGSSTAGHFSMTLKSLSTTVPASTFTPPAATTAA